MTDFSRSKRVGPPCVKSGRHVITGSLLISNRSVLCRGLETLWLALSAAIARPIFSHSTWQSPPEFLNSMVRPLEGSQMGRLQSTCWCLRTTEKLRWWTLTFNLDNDCVYYRGSRVQGKEFSFLYLTGKTKSHQTQTPEPSWRWYSYIDVAIFYVSSKFIENNSSAGSVNLFLR